MHESHEMDKVDGFTVKIDKTCHKTILFFRDVPVVELSKEQNDAIADYIIKRNKEHNQRLGLSY